MLEPTQVNMTDPDRGDITQLLVRWKEGDESALNRLTAMVYDDLVRVAKVRLRNESKAQTLQPTALVHEVYLRLANQTHMQVENRIHFFAIAANTMRRLLIEHARRRLAHKRNGGRRATFHPDLNVAGHEKGLDVLSLDDALTKLATFDKRKSRVIELKFFGGMTSEEIGLCVGISVATVGRELRLGQAWLRREMSYNSA
jgi:RNA polymerase sigma factor (TIGR02999 family)